MSDPRPIWQHPAELRAPLEVPAPGDPAGEFAGGRRLWDVLGEPSASRRDVLKALGFGLGAAALAGCSPIPERRAVPLLEQPAEMVPGVASWYATACGGCAAGCGLLAKVRDGRPIKVEGNPDAPVGRGGTCAVGQAAVLGLYDEGRLRGPLWQGRPVSWKDVDAAVSARLAAVAAAGQRTVLVTGPEPGPASRALIARFLAVVPGGRHLVHEPLPLAALRRANGRSFGRPVVPRFRFDRARLTVALDADFLGAWISPVEHTRGYAAARRPGADMGRHVQIEAGFSLTGANADRRIPLRPSQLGLAALALLAGVAARAGAPLPPWPAPPLPAAAAGELAALAGELWERRGESLVVCGDRDPALQLVVNRLNHLLGNVGRTLDLDHPARPLDVGAEGPGLPELLDDIERGEVGALLLWGVNPAYDHPQAGRLVRALERVALAISFADRIDETAAHVHAVCPAPHFLESWGDAEPAAGALHLRQPAIAPLFDTRAPEESLLRWSGGAGSWYDALREHWRSAVFPQAVGAASFDDFWDRALERGGWFREPGPAAAHADVLPPAELAAAAASLLARAGRAAAAGGLELRLAPAVALRDGRAANNPWLQELPDPVTRVAWGNVAALGPALAERLDLADGDVVRLEARGRAIELPALVQPGVADGTVAVALGYGRTRAGRAGDGVGANAFPLLDVEAGVGLLPTGRRVQLARVQTHDRLEGRPLVRELTPADLQAVQPAGEHARKHGEHARKHGEHPSLWPERPPAGHSWGMAIDLSACTGCAACVVACQAENNVAVVGPDEVRRGREMHWLRIDRYYAGPAAAPEALFQPMLCQHCAHAPCETVCPVLATVHSSDGLNQQVYNRCVGTRYCANNCPYKVRRFNWFDYAGNARFPYHMNSDLGRMVLNPDVVVRSRGVMEKCSLCIQRIQEGKLEADQRSTPLRDGAIQTACQQACPAGAITFGDRLDGASALAQREADPRFHRVLDELGTRPAVGYLAKVRNRPAPAERPPAGAAHA